MITFSRPKTEFWWHHINWFNVSYLLHLFMSKGGFRTAATSKMECFVIIVSGWILLTTITKHSILDVAAALDPPLTVLNILSNFISHEVIVCDDKDPPWFNGKIKSLINEKLRTYNAYRKNIGNSQLRNDLSSLQQRLLDLIDDSKQKCFLRLT